MNRLQTTLTALAVVTAASFAMPQSAEACPKQRKARHYTSSYHYAPSHYGYSYSYPRTYYTSGYHYAPQPYYGGYSYGVDSQALGAGLLGLGIGLAIAD